MTHKILPFLAALTLVLSACQGDPASEPASSTAPDGQADSASVALAGDAPTLEMFVMSQCPFGVQVLNAVAPVKQSLGNALNLEIGYIGDGEAGSLTSMHGPAEVKGNMAQLCAAEIAPDKYLDLILCQNEDMTTVDTNWKGCAERAGIDAAAMEACMVSGEGERLLAASFAVAQAKGARGSPTMLINGQPYEGGRKTRDFMRAVCQATPGEKPQPCKDLPEPPTVHAVFLSDKRCPECDISGLEARIRMELGGLQARHVDYMTEEGKSLYGELRAASPQFRMLPAVLLDATQVDKDAEGKAALQRFLRPIGKYQELMLGGSFDPEAEICGNEIDDDGDGVTDCSDDGCAQALECREAKPQTLDLFVMSQCPYGAQALIATKDVVEHFGDDITVNVHFIGTEQNGKLVSMHGQAEVDEDMRERCAIEKYGQDHQFMDYLACRSRDYLNPAWQPCAEEAGMDASVIQACFDGEGPELLRKSFALAQELKIGASPTFLSNNRREFNAIDPATVQREFCADNPSVEGCGRQLKLSSVPLGPG